MADWTNILDTALDPDAPLTSSLAYAWRDNPIAIAEGSLNAPKIAMKTASGLASGGNLAFTGLGAFSGVLCHGYFSSDGANRPLQLELSNDGTTYFGLVTLFTDTVGGLSPFTLFVDFATGNYRCVGSRVATVFNATGTISGSSLSVTAFRFLAGSANLSVFVNPQGGESAS